MNKYLIWTDDNQASYLHADEVKFEGEYVNFYEDGKLVRSFFILDYLRFNDREIEPVGEG